MTLATFSQAGSEEVGNGAETEKVKISPDVLIYSSINPKYDNRLFNDLRVQYEKITRAEHVKNLLFTQIV